MASYPKLLLAQLVVFYPINEGTIGGLDKIIQILFVFCAKKRR